MQKKLFANPTEDDLSRKSRKESENCHAKRENLTGNEAPH